MNSIFSNFIVFILASIVFFSLFTLLKRMREISVEVRKIEGEMQGHISQSAATKIEIEKHNSNNLMSLLKSLEAANLIPVGTVEIFLEIKQKSKSENN